MAVKRIVTNIAADDVSLASEFYSDILGLAVVMDHGWITTLATGGATAPQLSVASEGGSGTAVPDISIEVDNFNDVHRLFLASRFVIEYGPVEEP